MNKYKDDLAKVYIDVLNRFPDTNAYKTYYSIYKQKGIKRIYSILENSKEKKLVQKDIIFKNFINNNYYKFIFKKEFKKESDKCAILFDGRINMDLIFVIHEISYFLNDDWSMRIYCTQNNILFLKKHLKNIINIDFCLLNKLESFVDYNNIFLNIDFWNNLPFKNILIFQMDSLLCKFGIEKFLEYDFIGAPSKNFDIMNGGLSIRNVKAMIYCLTHYTPDKYMEEDLFFCKYSLVPY